MTKPRIAELENDLESILSREDLKVDVLKSICPINMSIIIPKTENNDTAFIARVTWLCKTVFDNLFCITTNYVAEDEHDEEFIIACPFLEDNAYYNYRISSDMLMGTLPHYLTDLEFYSDAKTLHNVTDCEIFFMGIEYDKDDIDKNTYHKITVSPEVFGTLSFFNSYMNDGILNLNNLKRSILCGPIEDNGTSIFEVDAINVLGLCKMAKKSTCVIVKMEVTHQSDTFTLMVPFDLGKKFPKKKFGKVKVDKFTEGFMTSEDEFIDDYNFTTELEGKEYLFLRCRNMNNDGKIFAIKTEIQKALLETIEEYEYKK